jgi:tetratricopeptide (TPR) repeat protein
MKRLLATLGLAVFVAALPAPAHAQTGIAQGKVVDQAGKPVVDADLEISFLGGITHKLHAKSNKKGEYIQVGLPPGMYRFTASKEGFQPAFVEIKVNLGDPTQIPEIKIAAKGAGGAGGAGAPGDKPQDLGPAAQAAVELVRQGKLDEAEAAYLDLISKAAPTAGLHYNLGYVYTQKKDYPKAQAQYEKVIELDPNGADGYLQLAHVYQDSGQVDKAIELLTKASADHAQDGKLSFALGLYNLNSGKAEAAEAAFQKTATLDPKNVETEFYLGILAVQQNKGPDAITHLEKYLASSPSNTQNVATAQGLLQALKKK